MEDVPPSERTVLRVQDAEVDEPSHTLDGDADTPSDLRLVERVRAGRTQRQT
jgi:hypothetical protein